MDGRKGASSWLYTISLFTFSQLKKKTYLILPQCFEHFEKIGPAVTFSVTTGRLSSVPPRVVTALPISCGILLGALADQTEVQDFRFRL